MKKSKEQKRLLVKYRKIPAFWKIVNDWESGMMVLNWVTGTVRVLDK